MAMFTSQMAKKQKKTTYPPDRSSKFTLKFTELDQFAFWHWKISSFPLKMGDANPRRRAPFGHHLGSLPASKVGMGNDGMFAKNDGDFLGI